MNHPTTRFEQVTRLVHIPIPNETIKARVGFNEYNLFNPFNPRDAQLPGMAMDAVGPSRSILIAADVATQMIQRGNEGQPASYDSTASSRSTPENHWRHKRAEMAMPVIFLKGVLQ